MILKYDPRKTLNTIIAENKLTIHLRQEIRGRYYFLQNDETGLVYATLEKTAPTEWKIKVYEMVFDKKTLKLKPATVNYDYNVFQEKTITVNDINALIPSLSSAPTSSPIKGRIPEWIPRMRTVEMLAQKAITPLITGPLIPKELIRMRSMK